MSRRAAGAAAIAVGNTEALIAQRSGQRSGVLLVLADAPRTAQRLRSLPTAYTSFCIVRLANVIAPGARTQRDFGRFRTCPSGFVLLERLWIERVVQSFERQKRIAVFHMMNFNKIVAGTAIAGSLGLAVLGIGTGVANAAPSPVGSGIQWAQSPGWATVARAMLVTSLNWDRATETDPAAIWSSSAFGRDLQSTPQACRRRRRAQGYL